MHKAPEHLQSRITTSRNIPLHHLQPPPPRVIVPKRQPTLSTNSPSILESLPPELILSITDHLPLHATAALALTNTRLLALFGPSAFPKLHNPIDTHRRNQFLQLLSLDMPYWTLCAYCRMLRRLEPPPVPYALSSWHVQLAMAEQRKKGASGLCLGALTCEGVWRKPVVDEAALEGVEIVHGCIPIEYKATPRISGSTFLWHVRYSTPLTRTWDTLSTPVPVRELSGIPLCPHLFGSKVRLLDDRAWVKQGLGRGKTKLDMREWRCDRCESDFRVTRGGTQFVLEAWRCIRFGRSCRDFAEGKEGGCAASHWESRAWNGIINLFEKAGLEEPNDGQEEEEVEDSDPEIEYWSKFDGEVPCNCCGYVL